MKSRRVVTFALLASLLIVSGDGRGGILAEASTLGEPSGELVHSQLGLQRPPSERTSSSPDGTNRTWGTSAPPDGIAEGLPLPAGVSAGRWAALQESLPPAAEGVSRQNQIPVDVSAFVYPVSVAQTLTPTRPMDADWMAESNQPSARLGYSVGSAGDVNGDGYDDVIAGAPFYMYDYKLDHGRAFVWYGSATGLGDAGSPANADWMAVSDQYAELGWSVGTAGDVNGDGYDDVIVGAVTYGPGEPNNVGAAFVWYGSATGLGEDGTLTNADWMAVGDQFAGSFGSSVAAAGDVNGDGYDDVIVGAHNYDDGQVDRVGVAFVWHGSATGLGEDGIPANADWKAVGDQEWDELGFSLGSAGDVNGDGYDDVIVGAFGYDSSQLEYPGVAFVWHGSAEGLGNDGTPVNADWRAEGDQAWSQFGRSLGAAGDVNGDGYDDVIVADRAYDHDQITDAGAVFVWHGSATGLGDNGTPANADWVVMGDQYDSRFGYSVGAAGDVSRDGYADIIVGTAYQGFPNVWGAAYVFYGSASGLLPSSLAWSIEADEAMWLGFSLGTAGDVNGDGMADAILGAINYSNAHGEAREGAAFVFHGQGLPHFLLDVSGPTGPAPGETVDYAISYANFLAQTVDNAVLVLALPGTTRYVDSTAGGVYWPERHQLFWLLGDLAHGSGGQVSARLQVEWGIPLGTSDRALATLAGTNWGQSSLDVSPYLSYEPRQLLDFVVLSEEDLLSERMANADLDLIYTEAISDGFTLGGLSRLTITNQVPITQVTLMHEEREEVMHIRRVSETVSAATFGPTSYSSQDASGGTAMDFQLETLAFWGSWVGTTQAVGIQAACVPTKGDCFLNCLGDNAPAWLLKNIAKVASVILGSYDCFTCFRGNDASCEDCATNLATKIPGVGEVVDAVQCNRDCDADPTSHTCTESKSYCDRSNTNPVTIFVPAIEHLRCDNECSYRWPPTPEYGPVGKVCQDCPGGPRFLKPDECCDTDTQAASASQRICSAIQEAGGACGYCEIEIQAARDPNAKFGVHGDVLPGQTLTYTLTYENEGSGQAFGVYVEDHLDEELDESTLTIHGAGDYLSATRTLVWDIGELAPKDEPGSSGSVSLTVDVREGLAGGTVIANEAVVHFPSVPEETPTNAVVNVVQPVVAIPQTVETTYARPVSITLAGRDVSDAPLTYAIDREPLYGELAGPLPSLTYTPTEDVTGEDRFSFTVSNGTADSRSADVTIVVHPSADDKTPPQVRWTRPGDGEVISQVDGTPLMTDALGPVYAPYLLVKFSEALDPTTVTTETLRMVEAGGRVIQVTPSYAGGTNWMGILIREPWRTTEYTVTLGSGLRDASGNPLDEDYAWSFGMKAAPVSLYLPLVFKQ